MEARTWFRISAAPVGAQLEALLEFAAARRAHYPTFLLVEREGLSGEEVARALDIPVNTVWTRLHHARNDLRRALSPPARLPRSSWETRSSWGTPESVPRRGPSWERPIRRSYPGGTQFA